MKMNEAVRNQALEDLCIKVRNLVNLREFDPCREVICQAMCDYPCAPQPHNLMGVVMELTGEHSTAMRHFRAAAALDPTYTPARENLTTYGTLHSSGRICFDESDCRDENAPRVDVDYSRHGIGHALRRKCS